MTAFVRKIKAGTVSPDVPVLVADDGESEKKIIACREGARYAIQVRRARNIKHHRLVFVMLADMFANQENYTSPETYRAAVKIAVGWVHDEPIISEDGSVSWAVKPLDFWHCGEDDFADFHTRLTAYAGEQFGWDFVERYESI